ncbi:MAG: S8 family serine peptidase [Bacteriovoracaceae bacterium]
MKSTKSLSKVWTLSLIGLLIFSHLASATAAPKAKTKTTQNTEEKYHLMLQNAFNEQFKANSFKVEAPKTYYSENLIQSEFASWGINNSDLSATVNLKAAWEKFEKKKDVVVAVIDTGIDNTHPFLKDNIYVPTGSVSALNFGYDFSKKKMTNTPSDEHGHGTHVSGIIKSIFPEVKILALKYFNPEASGQDNLNATIKALEYAVNLKVDIINYSGGGPEASEEELKILKKAEDLGILVVAASGNEESDIDKKKNAYFPASYGLSNILTVTAHNQSLKALESSNWGIKSVDISAPGFRIKSSIPQGKAGYMSGTSQATAFVWGRCPIKIRVP